MWQRILRQGSEVARASGIFERGVPLAAWRVSQQGRGGWRRESVE